MFARLSRHTALLLMSNLGGAALSFALSVIIGRWLGSDGLGSYSVVLAWVYPLSMVVEFGLATLATRDLSQDSAAASAYLHAITKARLVFGGVAFVALVAFAPLLSDDPRIVSGLVISAPLVIILPLYSTFTALFKARGAMWPIPYLNLGMLAAQVILTALFLASGGDILEALIANVVTSALQLAAAWALWRWRFERHAARVVGGVALSDLVRRAWAFALAALFAALQVRLSIILLEQLAGTEAVGYFAAANRFVEAGRMIPNAFFGALFPALSSLAAQPIRLQRTFSRAMWGLGAFGLLAALGAFVAAPALIEFSYGSAFLPTVPVLNILMVALVLSLLRGGRTLYHYAQGREQQVNLVNGMVIVIQTALSLWLIPRLSASGAAWALVVVEAAALALLWRDFRWMLPRRHQADTAL